MWTRVIKDQHGMIIVNISKSLVLREGYVQQIKEVDKRANEGAKAAHSF